MTVEFVDSKDRRIVCENVDHVFLTVDAYVVVLESTVRNYFLYNEFRIVGVFK